MADVMLFECYIADVEQRVGNNRIIWRERGCLFIVISATFFLASNEPTTLNSKLTDLGNTQKTECFGHGVDSIEVLHRVWWTHKVVFDSRFKLF